jgi:hypothetical protein
MDKIKFLPFDKLKKQPLGRKNKMKAAKEKAKLVNGINTEQLFSTIDLIKENPDIANYFTRYATVAIWLGLVAQAR